jgi:hypothetical protein
MFVQDFTFSVFFFNFTYFVYLKLFGRKREEVTGECRKLHKEEHNNVYYSNIIRMI